MDGVILNQIDKDADEGRFGAWGLSTVLDSSTGGQPVIPRNQFDALHFAASLTAEWPVGNAGLLHVYGYLLSTVETPHGYKRDRWVGGTLAEALGRPADFFLPQRADEADETVLQRVTDELLPHLEDPDADWDDILSFDDGVPDSDIYFRTTIVQPAGGPTALVYGMHDGERMRAITAFPLADATPQALTTLVEASPRMRYNAVLPDLPPRSPLVRRP
jgi:hypothetical protein